MLLDYLWLGKLANSLYLNNLGPSLLLKGNIITPRVLPAIVVYILFAVMIWWIVIPLADTKIINSFAYGALLGLVVYGIYDMTNLAVLKDWTVQIACVDWLWGIFICAITSGFCAYLKQLLN